MKIKHIAMIRSKLIVHSGTSRQDLHVEDCHMKDEEVFEVEFADIEDALAKIVNKVRNSLFEVDIGQSFGVMLVAAFIALSRSK